MYTVKYRPTKLDDFVGNKNIILPFIRWLLDWDPSNKKTKCALVSGLNGIGKSLLVELLLKKHDYNIINLAIDDEKDKETINCINMVIQKNAKVVCITSGGIIEKIAIENNFDYIIIPGNMPPRSCLGYSLIQMFYILHFNEIINSSFKNDFKNSIKLLEHENSSIKADAEEIAKVLNKKIPIIYSTTNNEAIAIRFRQQLNENSKVLCWHNTIPEMNHNELVGWASKNESLAVLILLDETDYKKNKIRAGLNLEVIKKYASSVNVIYSKGETAIEKAIYFINLCDWISIYLAEMREIDPIEVNVITELKNSLAQ